MISDRRTLTFFESMFYRFAIGPVVASVTLDGRVDVAAMERAVRLLGRDHPLLRCSFRETADDVLLELAGHDAALAKVEPRSNGLAQELNVLPVPNRPVYRISLSHGTGPVVLSLAGDHAGSDGRLNALLLRRLLGYYTALLRGKEPEPSGRSAFEGSLEEVLLAAYEPGPPQPQGEVAPPLSLADNPSEPGALDVRSLSFEPDVTTRLIATARKSGITITTLLAGALACAVRAQFPGTGSMSVAPAFAVDLRPRVDPPIAADAPFCCVARLVCSTGVDAGDQPAEVGRRIDSRLKTALDKEEIQRRLVSQRAAGKPAALPPMSFMVSNIGVIESHPVPDGLRVIDSRWAGTSRGPVPTLFASTVDGRLTLDLVYDTGFHRAEVIDEVVEHFDDLMMPGRG